MTVLDLTPFLPEPPEPRPPTGDDAADLLGAIGFYLGEAGHETAVRDEVDRDGRRVLSLRVVVAADRGSP